MLSRLWFQKVWKMGDDTLRYMYDPARGNDYNYWPTRYTGSSDSGGVHWNSGIANLGE
jgi:bacillolysin